MDSSKIIKNTKIAIISDIHGNFQALETVTDDIEKIILSISYI